MSKIIRILIILFIAINMVSINVFARDFSYIEESLNNLGIDGDYSENIIEYLNKLEVSDTQYNEIMENASDIVDVFGENTSVENLNFFQYYTLYDKVMNITETLDLGLDVNLNDKSFMLLDNNTKNILYEGDINSISELYSNYKKLDTSIDITEIVEEVKNNDIEDNINNVNEKNYNNVSNNESNNKYIENNKDIIINNDKNNKDILDKYIEKFDDYNENLSISKGSSFDWKITVAIMAILLVVILVLKLLLLRR